MVRPAENLPAVILYFASIFKGEPRYEVSYSPGLRMKFVISVLLTLKLSEETPSFTFREINGDIISTVC